MKYATLHINKDEGASQLGAALSDFAKTHGVRVQSIMFSRDWLSMLPLNEQSYLKPTGSKFLDEIILAFDISYRVADHAQGYYGVLYGMDVYFETANAARDIPLPPFSCTIRAN
jgi:hypothetical protein